MPPPLLIDLTQVDLHRTFLTRQQIYERLPHAFEFQLLDGLCLLDRDRKLAVAYADIDSESWWVRGHIPGRPLLPGVLMLEMAAQSSAILAGALGGHDAFVGFGGIDRCKFRETVVPPARLYILCVSVEYRPRRVISDTQGVVDARLIFEARITGMTLR